jgi:DNA processing protein
MDYRLALLLQFPLGLKLDPMDISRLLDPRIDVSDVQAVLSAVRSESARRYLHLSPGWRESSEKIWTLSAGRGIRWSYIGRADYPRAWMGLSKRPLIFSYRGESCWQNHPLISIVGSRTPSPDTRQWMQRELPRFLKLTGAGVVSGGARGVDQWAHRIAMDAGCPTVCLQPTGLLNPYPDGCEAIWERIVAGGGCLISTCALDEPLRKGFFAIRNTWIAGLSPLCFVVEANRRSGSMLTAEAALREDRLICTLPVFPTATQGLANLDLLNDGAAMVRDHLDLLTLWNTKHCPTEARSTPT